MRCRSSVVPRLTLVLASNSRTPSYGIYLLTLISIRAPRPSERINPLPLRHTHLPRHIRTRHHHRTRKIDRIECIHQQRIRRANHSVLLRGRPNELLRRSRDPIVPRVRLLLGRFGELGVQFCGLVVVVLDALLTLGAEAVLVERVDLDGGADAVGGAQVFGCVSWGWTSVCGLVMEGTYWYLGRGWWV